MSAGTDVKLDPNPWVDPFGERWPTQLVSQGPMVDRFQPGPQYSQHREDYPA